MPIKYKFLFFWPNFQPKNNFFIDTFEVFLADSRLLHEFSSNDLEFEMHSVFGWPRKLNGFKRNFRLFLVRIKRELLKKNIVLIWYSGELGKVPKGYDLTLSYSPTLRNNIYLPVWAIYTTHLESHKKYDRDFMFKWDEILSERPVRSFENNRMACTFISNPSKYRLSFAKELESLGVLDIYGKAVGKPVVSKSDISKEYIFQLCLENEECDNYVTEKPFEAWMSGNIPIYKKNGSASPLNANAIVQITSYEPDVLRKVLENLVADVQRLESVYSQPILSSPLEMKEFKVLLTQACKKRIGKF